MPNITSGKEAYKQFTKALSATFQAKPDLICQTMSNVFSMRMIGNKTHGDLAEVAFAEFVTQHVKNYSAKHVGKDLFRAKTAEEDILVQTPSGADLPISLKAYGAGPLQLSTNREGTMFPYLEQNVGHSGTTERNKIRSILDSPAFRDFHNVHVLPLIYDEKRKQFNIIVFDAVKAYLSVCKIEYVRPGGRRRVHPIYKFSAENDQYAFEVRYGGVTANALQRGLWTHTVHASLFIKSLTGWMPYEINKPLISLMAKVLLVTKEKHEQLLDLL